jgi:pimeloyl-ACP methyl ester carboxylesterase
MHMRFTSRTLADGVSENQFTLGDITGVLWLPEQATGQLPLILLGHGGGQDKQAPGVAHRARHYVTRCGFASAAIDAPGHGGRPPVPELKQHAEAIRERVAAGESLADQMPAYNELMARHALPEWHAVIAALRDTTEGGPLGYWGVSMAGALGVRLVAHAPAISAAVLGLVRADGLVAEAAAIKIPVQFLVQWDDEMVPRESALELFDALGSADKTLQASPGGHREVPRAEIESSALFFTRHLGQA